jgi:cell division septum initiation protein DivIVA
MLVQNETLNKSLQEVKHELATFRESHAQCAVHKFAVMVAAEEQKKKLAKPTPKVVKALTEAQRILAEQPQTTSGEIGHHKVPVVDTHPPAKTHGRAGQLSKYHELQKTFPELTSGEVGFHPAYSHERKRTLSEAQRIAQSIDRDHVRRDPELRAGLDALRERVLSLKSRQVF